MAEPALTIRAAFSSFTPGDNMVPTRVVVHATCPNIGYDKASAPGAALGTARYFASASAGGSAHYVCGVDGEQHCVPDDTIAYHAPPNARSLGIEITAEGGAYPASYTRDQWLSPAVWPAVERAAARTRELCQRFAIPPVRINATDLLNGAHGICGHVDVSQAWHQTTHTDPGPEFPWPEFMALVAPSPAAPSSVEDTVQTSIALTFYNDSWQPDPAGLNFRASVPAECGAGSAVIGAAWVRWVCYWGALVDTPACPHGWKIVAWDETKPIGEADYTTDWWRLPEQVRGFTVEGRRANPGVIPAAALIVSPK